MKRLVSVVAALVFCLGAVASGDRQSLTVAVAVYKHASPVYSSPGASMRLSQAFFEVVESAQATLLPLELLVGAEVVSVEVQELKLPEGLVLLSGAPNGPFDLTHSSGVSVFELPLTVYAESPGVYYLHLAVNALTTRQEQQAGVLTVKLTVGLEGRAARYLYQLKHQRRQVGDSALTRSSEGRAVRAFYAEETVR